MSKDILHKRGSEVNLPLASPSELLYTTDSERLFYGGSNKNIEVAQRSEVNAVSAVLLEHYNNKGNPHSVTKEQVGLGDVDNTSDTDKPVSDAQRQAIDSMGSETLESARTYTDTAVANLDSTGGTTVVDTLTSTSTEDALSAYQGKVLNESKISGYQNKVTTSSTSTAIGSRVEASGNYSFAQGEGSKASAAYSSVFGYYNQAVGQHSHSQGSVTYAAGYASFAGGVQTEAMNYASMAIGAYNKAITSDSNNFVATADAFTIGNGTVSSLSNAFRVTFDGKVFGRSAYNSSGADYAEYFEWLDGNINEEDRVGYFVALDGNKIRKANSTDEYILGIISANASVVGNSASEGWNEQYVKDEFGRVQYHYVDVPHEELDENGKKVTVIKNEYHPVYSPNYDPAKKYIPREERSEWDAVGMVGILIVRDDGTCEINGYCKSDNEGIATKSEEGYRVMKRVSDNIIQVLVR